MKWVFEKDFLQGDHRLMAVCKKLGYDVELVDRYSAATITKEPIVFRGGIPFYLNLMKNKAIPGFYCTLSNYCCTMYYPRMHNHLLNKEYIVLPYGSIWPSFDWLSSKLGREIFIKPNSGAKLFAGQVISRQEHVGNITFYEALKAETLVVLSPAKPISKEWRFVVCNKKIITGSLYKPHQEDESERSAAGMFAEFVVKSMDWEPDPVWTIDICLSDGRMSVVEINSFSCAGLYDCDALKVVKAVSEQAEIDYKEYYE